jgi:hypothetical protein
MSNIDNIERIAHGFRLFELANILPFRDAMRLADRLLTHNYMYDPWRHYAIEFLYAIRDRFPPENNRNIQIDPPEELPHHEEWVFLN